MKDIIWAYKYIRNIKGIYAGSILLESLSVIAQLGMVIITKYVIDDIFGKGQFEKFTLYISIFAASITMYIFGHAIAFILMRKTIIFLRYRLTMDLLKSVLGMKHENFVNYHTGQLFNYFSNEATLVADLIGNRMLAIITNVLKTAVLLLFIGITEWPLVIFVLVCACLYILLANRSMPKLKAIGKDAQEQMSRVTTNIEEGISATKEVIAFGNEQWEKNRLMESMNAYIKTIYRMIKVENKLIWSGESLKWGVIVFLLGYGSYRVIHGDLSVGSFVVLYSFCSSVIDDIYITFNMVTTSGGMFAAAERLRGMMDHQPVQNGTVSVDKIRTIDFHQVTFAYPGTNTTVLNKLDLSIPAGKKTALVGSSGCGKSTILQLLVQFYQPSSGEIRINGIPIQKINRESLLSKIAIVFQEPYLFPDTIRNNLTFGNPDVSGKEIEEALRIVALDELISQLPKGLDTYIGDRGLNLSGGQRQRIALARALLQKPDLLILDEATSSLDLKTEAVIQRNLDQLVRDAQMTVLIVAHRLSTIQNADSIHVLKDGKIVEQGTHEELMSASSDYSQFVQVRYSI